MAHRLPAIALPSPSSPPLSRLPSPTFPIKRRLPTPALRQFPFLSAIPTLPSRTSHWLPNPPIRRWFPRRISFLVEAAPIGRSLSHRRPIKPEQPLSLCV